MDLTEWGGGRMAGTPHLPHCSRVNYKYTVICSKEKCLNKTGGDARVFLHGRGEGARAADSLLGPLETHNGK